MTTLRARLDRATESLSPSVGDPRRTVAVAAGDLLAITAVVGWGLFSHYGAAAFATPADSVATILPFLVGWPIPALLAGVYDDAVVADAVAAVRYVAVAWVAAANIGLILRTSPLFGETATWPFPLVLTAGVLVVLVGWRAVLAYSLDSTPFRSA
jgi:hypothetical protein